MSFLEDVMLWNVCKELSKEGKPLNITLEQKRRLYVLQASLTKVYFIEAVGSGVIKIGKTGSLDKRLATLQNASPVKLNLLMTIEYDDELEKRIHRHLAEYRSHGEWFYACKPVREFMRSYLDKGLHWLVDTVGDAPDHWMNYRRGLPDHMRGYAAIGDAIEDDVTPKI